MNKTHKQRLKAYKNKLLPNNVKASNALTQSAKDNQSTADVIKQSTNKVINTVTALNDMTEKCSYHELTLALRCLDINAFTKLATVISSESARRCNGNNTIMMHESRRFG